MEGSGGDFSGGGNCSGGGSGGDFISFEVKLGGICSENTAKMRFYIYLYLIIIMY